MPDELYVIQSSSDTLVVVEEPGQGDAESYTVVEASDTVEVREIVVLTLDGGGQQQYWEYTPPEPAIQWAINHPLPFRPNVTVLVDNQKVMAPVTYDPDDPQLLFVDFTEATMGKAILS